MHDDENETGTTVPTANVTVTACAAVGKELQTAAYQKFQHAKTQCLYGHKRDKSSVGQWDSGVIELCTLINEKFSVYYTTSSCAGRCFMYTGMGIKQNSQSFVRCRISHTKILDPDRYFRLQTLREDPTGGGDVIAPYNGGKQQRQLLRRQQQQQQQLEGMGEGQNATHHDCDDHHDDNDFNENEDGEEEAHQVPDSIPTEDDDDPTSTKKVWWIRYEPFILHVACRSLPAAVQFMNMVRPIFKTVGITSLSSSSSTTTILSSSHHKNTNSGCPKFVVAVYGDEGLDMPLTNEHGVSMIQNNDNRNDMDDPRDQPVYTPHWLAALVNERHERNANKIARLVETVRQAAAGITNEEDYDIDQQCHCNNDNTDITPDDDDADDEKGRTATTKNTLLVDGQVIRLPRSYDVIGDVAILNAIPLSLGNIFNDNSAITDNDNDDNDTPSIDSERRSMLKKAIGDAIQQRNQNIKVVVVRSSNLDGSERAPGMDGIQILTGPTDRIQRLPLITTHREYGVSCVVNLHQTFFSPRMGRERIRICEQIGTATHLEEDVLVLFAGVCMDAFLIAARTNAKSVTAIESNDAAFECAQKGHSLLERNKQFQHNNAAQRLQILHGDCLQLIPTLPLPHYHRILAPRPKEGNIDGDQPPPPPSTTTQSFEDASPEIDRRDNGSGGKEFLVALLSVLQPNGGICHWYDFCADHEYPSCTRSVQFLSDICQYEYQYDMEVLHIAHAGSVAKRQLRICVDFRVSPISKT